MITIVDYGLGNLGSVKNMLSKLGVDARVSNEPSEILDATKLILPGVGSFDTGMQKIRELSLTQPLHEVALQKRIPVLGICLGAQLMTKRSEEGVEPGLGWFNAETVKFNHSDIAGRWPLPNIGWRDVEDHNNSPLLLSDSKVPPRFYFVHSYVMTTEDETLVSMTTSYGYRFVCGMQKGNLYCVQFHPEKSHSFGFNLLKNFSRL